MRILLDENIPVDLALELAGHRVDTVDGAGWRGVANGELLQRAAGRYDAFVTMDQKIEHQQNLSQLSFGILVLHAHSNRLIHLRPLVPGILDALISLAPGQILHVGA